MPSLHVVAIRPARTNVIDPERQLRKVEALLGQAGFAGGMIRRMADYPPQTPAYSSGQSLGHALGALKRKRVRVGPKEYVRTGTLGRGWQLARLGREGDDVVAEVTNLVPYTVYVQGDPDGPIGLRQTDVMADKGWQNLPDEAQAEWEIWKPRIVRVFSER